MKMLAAALGAITAITLLSGCAYDSRYAYGYGDRYAYGYGYGGDRYYRYGDNYGGGYYGRQCWYNRYGYSTCLRP